MLGWTRHPAVPSLRLLVLHDDAERDFDYMSWSEKALERAAADNWTVVSVKNEDHRLLTRREQGTRPAAIRQPVVFLLTTAGLGPCYSRISIPCASRSRSMYGSPLTSTATRLIVPPVKRYGRSPG